MPRFRSCCARGKSFIETTDDMVSYDKFRTRERFARKVLYQYENKRRARATPISTYNCLTTRVKPRSITKVSLKHNNELNMNHLKRYCAEMTAIFFELLTPHTHSPLACDGGSYGLTMRRFDATILRCENVTIRACNKAPV